MGIKDLQESSHGVSANSAARHVACLVPAGAAGTT